MRYEPQPYPVVGQARQKLSCDLIYKKISFFEYEEGSKLLEGDSTARRTNTATYKQALCP